MKASTPDSPGVLPGVLYAFGPVLIDVQSRQVWRDGELVAVASKAFDALTYLVARPDQTVTKEELINAVWTDVSVTEDSLVHSISALRRAIGDDSANPKSIVTVPRRGYRLTGPVHVTPDPTREPRPAAVESETPEPARAGVPPRADETQPWPPRARWAVGALTVVLAATAVLVGVAGGFAGRTPATLNEPVLLSQPAPPGSTLASGGILSPDSRYMVSVVQDRGATQARLYLKQMNSGDLRLLAGTEGASHPFWSPTSDVIGFFANRALKTVNLRGDAPTVITTVPVSASGGTWSSRGSPILFADWQIGLYQVSPFGGTATRVTTINRAAGERAHNLPQFLPDGRHYLFFVLSSNADRTGTYVGSLDPGEPARLVVQSGSAAVYADPGYLLYVQNNGLVARQFDAARLQLRGAPQTLARDVSAPNDGEGQLISASSSLLTYRSGAKDLELAWFDREGRPAGIIPGGRALRSPMFSSDQKQLVAVSDRASLWVVDLERNAAARAEGEGLFPLWSPDGSRVAFESPSSLTLYVRNIDGPLREQVILQDGDRKILSDWSAAGDYLVYSTLNPVGNLDVSVIPMSGDKKPVALLRGPSNEMQARISPNGRSMAYVSDESGTLEVYVQDFPMLGHKRIVSIGGGTEPAWRQDGKELYYLSPDYSLVAVPIGSTDPLQIGQPKPLFRAPVSLASTRNHYAVTADGQRFLINVADEVSYRSPITVMVNWMQGLHAQ